MFDPIETVSMNPFWGRRLLNILWVVVILTTGLEWICYLAEVRDEAFSLRLLYNQGLLLVGAVAVGEIAIRIPTLRRDYTLITVANILTSIILVFHPDVPVMPAVLMISLFSSILYFRVSHVILSFCQSILFYTLILLIWNEFRSGVGFTNMLTVYTFLTTTAVIALLIVFRGRDILRTLQNTNNAHQELLVKSIIMDKLFKMDALTELYNHKTFHEYLEKLIDQSERNDLQLHLAVIDLDNFKKVNDTFGHHVGDHVLMRTAAILRNSVTGDDFVARFGGEEFAVIFTDKNLQQCYQMMEKVRSEMENLKHEELGFRSVTCSIGLEAYIRGTGKDFLFKSADDSLYAAKKRGKNQISSTGLPPMTPAQEA